jgi:hypothetical protein
MHNFLVLAVLALASGCAQDAEPQPVSCGTETCNAAQYCAGRECDDVAQNMGQCTTIGTMYACVSLPSSCANDATCECLMHVNELKNLPGGDRPAVSRT